MNDNSSALRIGIAIMLGIILIVSAISGNPGSLLGALIDAEDMTEVSSNNSNNQGGF